MRTQAASSYLWLSPKVLSLGKEKKNVFFFCFFAASSYLCSILFGKKEKMRTTTYALLAALMLLTTACHKDKHKDEVPTNTLSVLVYLAGDNALDAIYYDYEESRYINFVDADISQMIEGTRKLPKGQNLIIFVDRKNERPYFLHAANGDTTRVYTCKEELKSSDAATLQMAMQWMMDNYEAKSYGLALWGHSDGWTIYKGRALSAPRKAYGQDNNGGSTWMEIPDMADALEKVCKGQPLRFIFADCCNFQSIESAYELRHVTDYIIGSPAEIPGEGAPYETVLPALFSQSDDFYKNAADAYFHQTSIDYEEPMSVIRTSALDDLAAATKAALAQSLMPLSSGTYPDVKGLIYYYSQCMHDMNDFMLHNTPTEVYSQWKRSLDAAVPYKLMATVWMSNNFVPYLNSAQTFFRDFEVTEERYGGVSMFAAQDPTMMSATRFRNYYELQRKKINRMEWYKAAGLDQLEW